MLDFSPEIQRESQRRPDAAIAALADAQHGIVSRRQLIALGIGEGGIDHRLSVGRLHRVFRGVFAVGRRGLPPRGLWMAAVLACGEDARLSHRSAAGLWGIAMASGVRIDVTKPGTRRRRRAGLIVHGAQLHDEDCTFCDGIPTTSVERTLLDYAEVTNRAQVERALDAAQRLELLDLAALERVVQRGGGRRGLKILLALMPDLGPAVNTRSELERRFLDFCRRHGLSPPSVNVQVAGLEVDAIWTGERLVVELDGFEFHKTRNAFERDRERDARLLLAGYTVLRVTARRLEREPEAIAATIQRLLSGRARLSP